MTLERFKGLIEYSDSPELGIRGSDSSKWVPVEFVAVKTLQLLKSSVAVVDKAYEAVNRTFERLRGSTVINGKSGNVYESTKTAITKP